MYDNSLHYGRKHFCRYCLHAFIRKEKLKRYINGKQTINVPKEGEYVKIKYFERIIKPPLIIYANFESILVLEDNRKQNPNGSYTKKNMLLVVMFIN